jgi:acetate kinase
VPFYPEPNQAIYNVAVHCIQRRPGAKHALLCDTAFFHTIPEAAPQICAAAELNTRIIRRYGGDGLCHMWVFNQMPKIRWRCPPP